MIAHVTDWDDSIGAVRTRRPLPRVSSLNVLTGSMLARPIGLPVDEPDRLPVLVDGGALVVDETGGEPDLLHSGKVEVGVELRGLLRPGDPETVRRRERLLQRREAALELGAAGREEDDDLGAGLGAQLLRQRRRCTSSQASRCSTRKIPSVPNSSASAGTRSSAAWISVRNGRSGGSLIGRKPYVWMPRREKKRPSVTPI